MTASAFTRLHRKSNSVDRAQWIPALANMDTDVIIKDETPGILEDEEVGQGLVVSPVKLFLDKLILTPGTPGDHHYSSCHEAISRR